MTLFDVNPTPSGRQRRWFGLVVLLTLGLIGGVVWWRTGSLTASVVLWSAGAAFCITYYAIRPLQRPLYLGYLYAVYPIGWVVSHTVMALVYYLVFTSIGLLLRLAGRDPMKRRWDRSAETYWVRRDPRREVARYFRQF